MSTICIYIYLVRDRTFLNCTYNMFGLEKSIIQFLQTIQILHFNHNYDFSLEIMFIPYPNEPWGFLKNPRTGDI